MEELIERLRRLQWNKATIQEEERAFTDIALKDVGEIPELYRKFKVCADPENKDNTKIFIFVVFFMFSPLSCVSRKIKKGKIRRKIAEVLEIDDSRVSQQFGDAKVLYRTHKGFHDECERVHKMIQ